MGNRRSVRPSVIPPVSVDVAGAATAIGCGLSTVRKAIADGRLPAKKIGSRTIIEVGELKAFVARLARCGFHPRTGVDGVA